MRGEGHHIHHRIGKGGEMSREHWTRRLLAPPKRLVDVARPFVAAGVVLVILQVVFAVPAFAASGSARSRLRDRGQGVHGPRIDR